MSKRYFGNVRKLASGRYQARYTGPDGSTYAAPKTFDAKGDAETWLSLRHSEITRNAWLPPSAPSVTPVTFREYGDAWLISRDLEVTTRDHYRQLLRDHIYPTFGDDAVASITPAAVRAWHATLARPSGTGRNKVPDRPTTRAHAYGLLRTIMNTAVADEVIAANPCRVRGGGRSKRVKRIKPASLAELETLVKATTPARYELMMLLASWCGLRQGELFELRRSDIDLTNGVIHVRRGVTRTKGDRPVKGPKSDAGKRDVNIPPHLMPAVKDHLKRHAQVGGQGLLFPAKHGGHMAPSTLYRVFYPARAAAGRPDLRFHDLRHTGAVLAAATGATLAELMARLGHSTPGAALRYQHAAAERDKVIAAALSKLVTGNVTPIENARSAKKSRKRKEANG